MTSFLRNIFQATAGPTTSASTSAATPSAASSVVMTTPSTSTSTSTPAPTSTMRPDIVKVEIVEPSTTTLTMNMDTGKVQRAARRDAVNARRDKRKAGAASDLALSPTAFSDLHIEDEDKSKKMKTSHTSSFAVAGGLGASTSAATPAATTPSTSTKPSSGSASGSASGALLFTPEIDPAGEERIRAMEAQLETLDPDSKEAKKKRRLIRNRMSAQLHRERKKAYVGQLEEQLLEKDRELKALQEKLSKMMDESEKLRKQMETPVAAPVPAAAPVASTPASPAGSVVSEAASAVDEVAMASATTTTGSTTTTTTTALDDELLPIKEEVPSWESPWPMLSGNADAWDLALEDTEMVDFDTDDLLRNIDNPFAALDASVNAAKPSVGSHGELHTAKKNIAMMMAVMFSVGFFGNTNSLCDISTGSAFPNLFEANSAKEFSQISIASRIVACLEKTSWKDFRDVSSWLSQRRKAQKEAEEAEEAKKAEEEKAEMELDLDNLDAASNHAVASPSAHSDITDVSGGSCGSPAPLLDDDSLESEFPTSLMDDFVEEPFAMGPLSESNWLEDDVEPMLDETLVSDVAVKTETPKEATSAPASGVTSRLYSTLSTLWREKHQVLLTVFNDKQEVLRRSVADMSTIQAGLQTGDFFTPARMGDEEPTTVVGEDHSISFLYPISAMSNEQKSVDAAADTADPVFFEVSCQLNTPSLPTLAM